LVLPRRVAEAFALLRTRGYQAEFPRWVLSERMMCNGIETALWRADGRGVSRWGEPAAALAFFSVARHIDRPR
jgi:hypothetical protein